MTAGSGVAPLPTTTRAGGTLPGDQGDLTEISPNLETFQEMTTMTSGISDENVCSGVTAEPVIEASVGNLLVIFDRSISMGEPFGNGTRWEAVNNALLQGLAPFVCTATGPDTEQCMESLNVASVLFPSPWQEGTMAFPFDLCSPVDPLDATTQIPWQSVGAFVDAWNTYWAPMAPNAALLLGTPIPRAFEQGDGALSLVTEGNAAVLFLTDGESTCEAGVTDPMGVPVVDRVTAWQNMGIKTHVVSVAGGDSTFNDQVATAGGTMQSLNPADPAALQQAISDIVKATVVANVACKVQLEGKQISDVDQACQLGEVLVGPNRIACDPVDGFQVLANGEIELNGRACNILQTSASDLSAKFPCTVYLE